MAISIQPTREAEGLELNQFGAAASNQVYYQVIGANNETEASLAYIIMYQERMPECIFPVYG